MGIYAPQKLRHHVGMLWNVSLLRSRINALRCQTAASQISAVTDQHSTDHAQAGGIFTAGKCFLQSYHCTEPAVVSTGGHLLPPPFSEVSCTGI